MNNAPAPRRPNGGPPNNLAEALMEMIEPEEHEELIARLCHALGHPLRVGIVRYIATHPRCICNDIVLRTNRAQSTISEHLRVLVHAGLVECEADGQATTYWLATEALRLLGLSLERISALRVRSVHKG
jgi:ArsR family transcriptional regulator